MSDNTDEVCVEKKTTCTVSHDVHMYNRRKRSVRIAQFLQVKMSMYGIAWSSIDRVFYKITVEKKKKTKKFYTRHVELTSTHMQVHVLCVCSENYKNIIVICICALHLYLGLHTSFVCASRTVASNYNLYKDIISIMVLVL